MFAITIVERHALCFSSISCSTYKFHQGFIDILGKIHSVCNLENIWTWFAKTNGETVGGEFWNLDVCITTNIKETEWFAHQHVVVLPALCWANNNNTWPFEIGSSSRHYRGVVSVRTGFYIFRLYKYRTRKLI